jgi:hypothetical protein
MKARKKTPLHEKWEPKRYVADYDDIRAEFKAWQKFNARTDRPQMNEAELLVHTFACGFYRGIGWANFKSGKSNE